jgi:hypothetical protein
MASMATGICTNMTGGAVGRRWSFRSTRGAPAFTLTSSSRASVSSHRAVTLGGVTLIPETGRAAHRPAPSRTRQRRRRATSSGRHPHDVDAHDLRVRESATLEERPRRRPRVEDGRLPEIVLFPPGPLISRHQAHPAADHVVLLARLHHVVWPDFSRAAMAFVSRLIKSRSDGAGSRSTSRNMVLRSSRLMWANSSATTPSGSAPRYRRAAA